MIESLVRLCDEVDEGLKMTAGHDLRLTQSDIQLMKQLCDFLTPFKQITDLVSTNMPNLGIIFLAKKQILKVCTLLREDCSEMEALKKRILARLDHRIQISDTALLAAVLDPSIKKLVLKQVSHDDIKAKLLDASVKLNATDSAAPVDAPPLLPDPDSGTEVHVVDSPCANLSKKQSLIDLLDEDSSGEDAF